MYTNGSVFSVLLTLPSLELSETSFYPASICGIVAYMMILISNLTVATTICFNRNLHKPMYLLLLNLQITDTMGATSFFPHMLYSIWSQDRSIYYSSCLLQGFLIHLYSGQSHVTLIAMAFDRYIAICFPLRYGAIMTLRNLVRIITILWSFNFLLVIVLFSLLLPHKICQTNIGDLFCNNPSLMKIMCEDMSVNNFYGVFLICIYFGLSLSVVVFTYIHILVTCLTKKQSDSKVKAVQTCGTHLVVFLFLELNTFFPLIAHRIESIPAHLRRVFFISVLVFPPIVNPLIYGFKITEIRQTVARSFKCKTNKVR